MANTVSAGFETQWATEVKLQFQQGASKLRPFVRLVTGITGDTYKFPTLEAFAANTKSRNADLTYIEPQHAVKTATMTNHYAPVLIDDLDVVKQNADLRKYYIENTAAAIGRQFDKLIIAALDASNTAITTTNGAFSMAKLLQALRKLNASNVPSGERVIVISSQELEVALGETKLTSADYQTMRALVSGEISSALGAKWVVFDEAMLSIDTATTPDVRKCYVFNKNAVGAAINKDIMTTVERIAHKDATQVLTKMSAGAVVIEATGNIQILCDIS